MVNWIEIDDDQRQSEQLQYSEWVDLQKSMYMINIFVHAN